MTKKKKYNFYNRFMDALFASVVALKNYIVKYNIILLTFSISILSSLGIAIYSANHAKEIFSVFWVGFTFILLIEIGLVTLRYIAVAVGVRHMWIISILQLIFFIMSIIPGTMGTNQKHRETQQVAIVITTEDQALVNMYQNENKTYLETIRKNNKRINQTNNTVIFDKLVEVNEKYEQRREVNITKIKNLRNQTKNDQKAADAFYKTIDDFFLKSLVAVVQILNVTMSLLGSMHLQRIKNGVHPEKEKGIFSKMLFVFKASLNRKFDKHFEIEAPVAVDVEPLVPVTEDIQQINNRLVEHEDQLANIKEYTNKIKDQMVELAGELEKDELDVELLNSEKISSVGQASQPSIFKSTLPVSKSQKVKKGKKV